VLLKQALLFYASHQGCGLSIGASGAHTLQVRQEAPPPITLNDIGQLTGWPEVNIRRFVAPHAEPTPKVIKPAKDGATTEEEAQFHTPPQYVLPDAMVLKTDAQDFTCALGWLFASKGAQMLAREVVRTELANDFPYWLDDLKKLDQSNKVLIAEEAVFLI